MIQRKIPMRRCVGCNTSKPKKELVRVVRNSAQEISMDLIGKKPGRGAYICPDPACLAKAQKRKSLERAFECSIPTELFETLKEELLKAQMEGADEEK